MSTPRIHARNLLVNWGSSAANMVVLFFLSPFVVHTLGETVYGVWSLLMMLTGYMGIFDLGVKASTGRHIFLYVGRGDHQGVNETVRTGLSLFTWAIAVLVVAATVIAWGFPRVFTSVPEELYGVVRVLLPLLALNVWLSAVAAIFSSVLIAHDRFDLTCGVDLAVLAIRTVGTVFALLWGYGIVGLTVVTLACGVAVLAANYALARWLYRPLSIWPIGIIGARLRELFDYGVPAFICTASDRTINMISMLIVGALVSVDAVAVFSVGSMLVFYSVPFLNIIATTFFPAVQHGARGDKASLETQFLRQLRLGLVCGIPVFMGFIVFGESFIRLWMFDPKKFPEASVVAAGVVLAWLSGGRLLELLAMGSHNLLSATEHVRITAVIAIAQALVSVVLSLLLIVALGWGLTGAAVTFPVASLLVPMWLFPWQAMQRAKLSYRPYLAIVGSGSLATAAVAAWYLGVRAMIPPLSRSTFALDVFLALVGYAVIAFATLVPKKDRSWLSSILGRNAIEPEELV